MNKKPQFDNQVDYMRWRLDRRVQTITDRAEKVKRRYVADCDRIGEAPGEDERLWLDQFAKGNGLDIACGDFLCGDANGVDGHERMVGCDWWCEGDELAFQEPGKLDFVVTNYLDGFANPLKALNEWWRCIRPGGIIAIITRDSDAYVGPTGPLENARRQMAYNVNTLKFFLGRAGFVNVTVVADDKRLWATGYKQQ
ncbi:MAG: hypothetical protein ACXABY_20210 [Candidatus Thorarchaeota archaeon]|jgi:SAM-dependent methyltransferase